MINILLLLMWRRSERKRVTRMMKTKVTEREVYYCKQYRGGEGWKRGTGSESLS